MEWTAPAIVLAARSFGEADAVVTLLTEVQGCYRGLARGGLSRRHASLWQPGNLVQAQWKARLSEQLGGVTAELVHAAAALAMDDPLTLAILSSACAVAEGALPEREPHPRVFAGLVQLLAHVLKGTAALSDLIQWEAILLAELGYGLDLSCCAVTGATTNLEWVSPRTGRAVSASASAPWQSRLLRLPGLLLGAEAAGPGDWSAGLAVTGHFLARDAFGHQHRPLPQARVMLADYVQSLAER